MGKPGMLFLGKRAGLEGTAVESDAGVALG